MMALVFEGYHSHSLTTLTRAKTAAEVMMPKLFLLENCFFLIRVSYSTFVFQTFLRMWLRAPNIHVRSVLIFTTICIDFNRGIILQTFVYMHILYIYIYISIHMQMSSYMCRSTFENSPNSMN